MASRPKRTVSLLVAAVVVAVTAGASTPPARSSSNDWRGHIGNLATTTSPLGARPHHALALHALQRIDADGNPAEALIRGEEIDALAADLDAETGRYFDDDRFRSGAALEASFEHSGRLATRLGAVLANPQTDAATSAAGTTALGELLLGGRRAA